MSELGDAPPWFCELSGGCRNIGRGRLLGKRKDGDRTRLGETVREIVTCGELINMETKARRGTGKLSEFVWLSSLVVVMVGQSHYWNWESKPGSYYGPAIL